MMKRILLSSITIFVFAGFVLINNPARGSGETQVGDIKATPQASTAAQWVGTWGSAPDSPGPPLKAEQTLRQIIRISIGGSSVRIRLSNLFGTTPVTFGPVHV